MRNSENSLAGHRSWWLILAVALISCVIGLAASDAQASTPYDDFLHKAPSLYVYTDSPANTQTMDVSGSWWSDYKQAYAKRVGIDGWPIDFVARFGSMMSIGSWAVFIQENSDGTTISFFGTTDPNAYCDFSEPTVGAPTGTFGCTSHAGHDYATAEYFTHNSYGSNGCTGSVPPFNFCSDNGMNVYSYPVVGRASTENRFWSRFPSGSLNFYIMNFDLRYPEGYTGEQIGTKSPVVPPPTIICGVTPGLDCGPTEPTHPCDRRKREFGDALVTAWTCAAIQASNAALCGFNVAAIIVKPLKLVKLKLTKKGLVNVKAVKPSWRPIARIYNILAKSRISRKAPKGFRTAEEIVIKMSKVKKAHEFLDLLPKIQQAISAADFLALTKQVAKIAGLESCVDGVLLAAQS